MSTGFPDRLPERFTEDGSAYENTLRVCFPNGDHLLLQMAANQTLMIVSSTGEIRWHTCENGSMTVRPVRPTAAVKPHAQTDKPG
jgi:hypothetical protein